VESSFKRRVGETLADVVRRVELEVVKEALDDYSTTREAAAALGVTREGLYKMRRRMGLQIAPARGPRPKKK
jgi:DNA-binding NtrC family response regulator